MKTLYFENADREALSLCGELIREGKLVAFPTETVYGLGADATNTAAVASIYAAKGREGDNPLIVHFADPADIAEYAVISEQALFDLLVTAFMPGPLTLVLPRREKLSPRVSAGLSTVAVRVPSHETARAFIRAAARPIAAPSANRSHRPSPTTSAHVLEDLDGVISAVLEGGSSEHGVESTVLAVGEELRLLRPGAVTPEMIEAVTGREVLVDSGVLSRVEDMRRVASPGMKYRHYAPKAPLTAVVGEEDAVRAYFALALSRGDAVLCYEEDLSYLDLSERVRSLGPSSDYSAQASRLFAALREFDRQTLSHIYTRLPAGEGVGLAVKNRLLRACEFDVLEV